MKKGVLITGANRVCLCMFECVSTSLCLCMSVCEFVCLSLALFFPTLERHRINQKSRQDKRSPRYGPWKKSALLLQSLWPHIIFNWRITVKPGENYILKPGFEKALDGSNLLQMDAAGWGLCVVFLERHTDEMIVLISLELTDRFWPSRVLRYHRTSRLSIFSCSWVNIFFFCS